MFCLAPSYPFKRVGRLFQSMFGSDESLYVISIAYYALGLALLLVKAVVRFESQFLLCPYDDGVLVRLEKLHTAQYEARLSQAALSYLGRADWLE